MKTLRYMRHSLKKGNFITQEGLDLVYRNACDIQPSYCLQFTDLFYGPFYRTLQTLLAVVAALGLKARVHEAIPEIGSEADAKRIQTPELLKAVEGGMSEWDAFHQILPPEEQESLVESFTEGIRKMFALMPEGGHGLAVGHDLIIPLAVKHVTGNVILIPPKSLRECGYEDLTMDEEGKVRRLLDRAPFI